LGGFSKGMIETGWAAMRTWTESPLWPAAPVIAPAAGTPVVRLLERAAQDLEGKHVELRRLCDVHCVYHLEGGGGNVLLSASYSQKLIAGRTTQLREARKVGDS